MYEQPPDSALSLWTQGKLDHVLRNLVEDLRNVIPEHEIVLSFATATRAALLTAVPERELPATVDGAVRDIWETLISRPPSADWVGSDFGARRTNSALATRTSAGVGLLQLDGALRIAAADDQARFALGIGDSRPSGTPLLDLVASSHRPFAEASLRRGGQESAHALIVALRVDGGRTPALIATAPISGTSPVKRACAVARLTDEYRVGEPYDEVVPANRQTSHSLIECSITSSGGSPDPTELARRLRQALGPASQVTAHHGRISALVPAEGTIEGLRMADRLARLLQLLCEERGLPLAQVHTNLVCVGTRKSLQRLLQGPTQ